MTWITVSFSNVAIGARHQWRQNLYKDDTAVSNADVAKANNIYREKMQKNMQKSIQTEMKDMVRFIFSLLLLLSMTITAFAAQGQSVYGRLHVANGHLLASNGQVAVLHGMSTHGIQWFSQFTSEGAVKTLRNRGANLLRVAMYTAEGGYISNPGVQDKVFQAVDRAIANDMYAIIDWHILSDSNPRTNEQQAVTFFQNATARYGNNPGVIYEICNEPNGNVTWSGDIKPYAEHLIQVIREKAPDSIVIVGTPTWSQGVDSAAADQLMAANIMYACHFYAGTHGQWLRDKVQAAENKGAAIFVSEWGTSAADGNGGVFLEATNQWLDFLSQEQISWANWSLCDKNESSAALNPGANPNGGWSDSDLSPSGKFVFGKF